MRQTEQTKQTQTGKKIIFFDIDGTLVSHVGKSHVPEQTITAVRALAENGHTTAIATGRNLALTRKTAAFFGIDLLVCCNGAHVTRLSGGGDIYSAWLCGGFVDIFRNEASSVSDMAYAFDAEHVYTDWKRDFLDPMFDEQTGADYARKLSVLERAQAAYVFSKPSRTWLEHDGIDVIEERDYTEFRPSGVTKWTGIVSAAEQSGFSPDDIVVIGDGENDLDMVRNAPVGIAVGISDSRLKAVADLVTDDIDKGGILSAFRTLGMV